MVATPSGVARMGMTVIDAALMRVLDTATRVAAKDVTVLVRGETGTGKELMARAVHERDRGRRHLRAGRRRQGVDNVLEGPRVLQGFLRVLGDLKRSAR